MVHFELRGNRSSSIARTPATVAAGPPATMAVRPLAWPRGPSHGNRAPHGGRVEHRGNLTRLT